MTLRKAPALAQMPIRAFLLYAGSILQTKSHTHSHKCNMYDFQMSSNYDS